MKKLLMSMAIIFNFAQSSMALEEEKIEIGTYTMYPPSRNFQSWAKLIITAPENARVFYGSDLIAANEAVADNLAGLDKQKKYTCLSKGSLSAAAGQTVYMVYNLKNCQECKVNHETKTCE